MLYSKSPTHLAPLAKNVFLNFTTAILTQELAYPSSALDLAYTLSKTLHKRHTVDDFAYHDDMYYFGIYKYFNDVVIPHKIEVYRAGMELINNPAISSLFSVDNLEQYKENLILHDLSKFSADEAFGYAMYNRKTGHGHHQFEMAWHHHKMNNPHHPEYWFNPNRGGQNEAIPMPTIYVVEMVADWIGAGKIYGGQLDEWLTGNLLKFRFGKSIGIVKTVLNAIGHPTRIIDETLFI